MNTRTIFFLIASLIIVSLTSCSSESTNSVGKSEDSSRTMDQPHDDHLGGKNVMASTAEDSKIELGRRFLIALQENDVEKYHSCWLSIQDTEALIRGTEALMSGTEQAKVQVAQMRAHLPARDKLIRISFPILRRAMTDKCGELSSLEFADLIVSNPRERDGNQWASSLDVVLNATDNREIKYHIDDGILIRERWYFRDRPDSLLTITSENGESELVRIGEYATEEEIARFKQIGVQ